MKGRPFRGRYSGLGSRGGRDNSIYSLVILFTHKSLSRLSLRFFLNKSRHIFTENEKFQEWQGGCLDKADNMERTKAGQTPTMTETQRDKCKKT